MKTADKKLYVVGIGPGDPQGLTEGAHRVLSACSLLCGYSGYIRLVSPLFPHAQTFSTPMREEIARCAHALEQAALGRTVAMVCSGDAGVYGMAGPLLELAPRHPEVEIEIVPGVSAAQSGAAVLGAPLGHDYAVISLSDLLTPWAVIEQRLDGAARGDFCVCLYNPRSGRRRDHLARACRILLRHKKGETVCGWVRGIGREGQQSGVLPLGELEALEADMLTTIFVGNSATKVVGGRMVTPRGYGDLL